MTGWIKNVLTVDGRWTVNLSQRCQLAVYSRCHKPPGHLLDHDIVRNADIAKARLPTVDSLTGGTVIVCSGNQFYYYSHILSLYFFAHCRYSLYSYGIETLWNIMWGFFCTFKCNITWYFPGHSLVWMSNFGGNAQRRSISSSQKYLSS